MSPPCQPFTRNGLFKDTEDRRSDAFQSICEIIKSNQLPSLTHILMENVVGFEKSQMRDIFIDALSSAQFHFQEFIISPSQIGVANTRHRYYCIARKSKNFSFSTNNEIVSLYWIQRIVRKLTFFLNFYSLQDFHIILIHIKFHKFHLILIQMQRLNNICYLLIYLRNGFKFLIFAL